MNIMITRLLTGEEILGEIEINDNECFIKNPTQIGAMPNPKSGNIDIHMSPWIPLSSDKTVKINMSQVLCQYAPVNDIINKYNSMFGSGLYIPPTSKIASLD